MSATIIVWHVGGGGDDDGPTRYLKQAGFACRSHTFDARDGTCLSDRVGQAPFHVNRDPLSSSLFVTNQKYAAETCQNMPWTWGEVSATERTLSVETTTIDLLAEGKEQPDVLSIDAQGAELEILLGAANTLRNVLCVVSEVEFAPIYEGQPLFGDQAALLGRNGFRIMDLFSIQQWHPGKPVGGGMMTVAEAVWLRSDYENLTDAQTEKLAMIAAGFGRLSFVLHLLTHLDGRYTDLALRGIWNYHQDGKL